MLLSRSLIVATFVVLTIWFDVVQLEGSLSRPNLRSTGEKLTRRDPVQIRRILAEEVPHVDDDHPADDDHAADDHGAEGGDHGHPSLFEALSAIHVEIGTYAVFVIIGIILLLKQLIQLLMALTEDTPFSGMIGKIEEELMIVGSSSFMFKVVLNTTTFAANKWAYPLEFAEILVPLIAFSYCGLGVILILISLEQCYAWSRAHNLKTLEILDDYLNATKSIFFRWYPYNKAIEQMEFRIYNAIFCSTFKIQKSAFAFDEYVTKVFQHSVLELIEIRLKDWFYVTVLLCLNLGRVKLNWQWEHCELHDIECHERRDIYLYTACGAVVFLFSLLLLIASRRLERAILAKHGLRSHLQYAKYIQDDDLNAHIQEHHMDANMLKTAASKAKETAKNKRPSVLLGGSAPGAISVDDLAELASHSGDKNRPKPIPAAGASSRSTIFAGGLSVKLMGTAASQKAAFAELISQKGQMGLKARPEGKSREEEEEAVGFSPRLASGSGDTPVGAGAEREGTFPVLSTKSAQELSEGAYGGRVSPKGFVPADRPRGSPVRASKMKRSLSLRTGREVFVLGQTSEAISDVFWFGQPDLYFESVQMMFMVIAFYIALWLTVMVSAAPSSGWKVLSIVPAILVCCFFFDIVRTAAVLKAMYEVDNDALLEVIEETEAAKQLSDELREKVTGFLSCDADMAYAELEKFYKVIDTNDSNSLSRGEFGQFMSLLDITFSAKKWERIFKEIDRNYDNEISLQEFYLFLFPEHDYALKLEMRRLKVVSQRVTIRANKLLANFSPFRDVKLISSPSKAKIVSTTSQLTTSLKVANKFRAAIKVAPEGPGESNNSPKPSPGGSNMFSNKFLAGAAAARAAVAGDSESVQSNPSAADSALRMKSKADLGVSETIAEIAESSDKYIPGPRTPPRPISAAQVRALQPQPELPSHDVTTFSRLSPELPSDHLSNAAEPMTQSILVEGQEAVNEPLRNAETARDGPSPRETAPGEQAFRSIAVEPPALLTAWSTGDSPTAARDLAPDAVAPMADHIAGASGLPDSARFASASPDAAAVEESVAPDEDASPVEF